MNDLITEEELKAFIVAAYNRYGLDFRNYEIKSLKRGISRLMMKHQMKSSLDLWSRVLREPNFFHDAIDDLMVNLTELFRNPDAWMKMRDIFQNQYSSAKEFNIWHAGCSTGEEVYTMAIVLDDINLLRRTNAYAVDFSQTALNKAIAGKYSKMVMNNYLKPFMKFFPKTEITEFFDYDDDIAQIKSKFQRHVEFERLNLVQDKVNKKFDVILCRNVMIYFDESLKMQVLKMFHDCLNNDGYLVIGYYDTLPDAAKKYFETFDTKTRIYTKI